MSYRTKGFGANYQYKGKFKPIPTTYKGVKFKSKLEAQWAAFFDLCDCFWEYEPNTASGAFDQWRPDFKLRLTYQWIESKQAHFYLDFYMEVKPCDLVPFPDGVARKIMYAHPYDHPPVSINDLGNEDVGAPIKSLTDCPYDRVGILGQRPINKQVKIIKTTFRYISEIEVEELEHIYDEEIVYSGYYSTCFTHASRIWKPITFLGGDKKRLVQSWQEARKIIEKNS